MNKENKYESKFPKIHMIINPRTFRTIKTKIRNIYKDMDILSNVETGKATENSVLTRRKKKSSTNLFKIKLKNKQQKNSFSNTNRMGYTDMNKLTMKINLNEENKSSIINLNSSKKENRSETPSGKVNKINKVNNISIKNIKLNCPKKNINYFPNTSRYVMKNEIFQKEILDKSYKEQSSINKSLLNNENPNLTARTNNNSYFNIFNKIRKIKLSKDSPKKIKKLFRQKSKELMQEIKSIQKESEKEKENELIEKEKHQKIKALKILKDYRIKTMLLQKKIENIKFDENFELECKGEACNYQKNIGLFFRSIKLGLYTSHFFTVLKKDKVFHDHIIQKMPNKHLK